MGKSLFPGYPLLWGQRSGSAEGQHYRCWLGFIIPLRVSKEDFFFLTESSILTPCAYILSKQLQKIEKCEINLCKSTQLTISDK